MLAIFKREVSSYFNSMVGYIFLAVIYFFSGLFFTATSLLTNNADLNGVFSNMFVIVVFIMPILTMRMLSEDFKQKTDQVLFTAPVRMISVALGKYFSAVLIYLIGISITLVYGITIAFFTVPDWTVIIGNYIGLALVGMTIISIGMFISSLTESQIISAVFSYAVSLFVILIDGIAGIFNGSFIYDILSYISFSSHYKNFTLGIFDFSDVTFFVSICILFICLTSYVLEKRKWN